MRGFAHRWFSVGFIFLLMVASVWTASAGEPLDLLKQQRQLPTPTPAPSTSGQTRGCSFLSLMLRSEDVEKCRQLADAGDIPAMLRLAQEYELGIYPWSKDLHESIRYYILAADLGDKEALRHLYNAYRGGFDVPKNQARADQYLNKAAQFGSEWAILLLAQAQEKSVPKKALEAYLKLARNDNCIAQLRLAQAYESGDLVKQNLTQSYFWLLLASVDAYNRTADVAYDVTSGISDSSGQCSYPASKLRRMINAEETLSKKLVQAAQDAATNWTKGTIEKLLPPPQITADEASQPDTKSKMPTASPVPFSENRLPPPPVTALPPKVATASPVEESSPKLPAPPPATAPPTSAQSQDSREYIFDIVQRTPAILRAWERIVPSSYTSDLWVKELQGTTDLVQHIIINQKPFYLGSACKPHDCGGNFIVFLVAVDGSEAYGMLTSESLNATGLVFGRPNPERQQVMAKMMAEQFAWLQRLQVGSAVIPQPKSVMSVPMRMEGGTYVVPVLINGAIPLDFVVDSGASDVSIPADVVMTLMRTGTLQEADFLEKRTYVLADGSTVPSQTFRIRSLKVGDTVVENVTGSVAPVKGSLLLGQSFLGRFGSWRVDNNKHALILE